MACAASSSVPQWQKNSHRGAEIRVSTPGTLNAQTFVFSFLQQHHMSTFSRRTFITGLAAMGAGSAIASTPFTATQKKEPVVHHVFFWLKNPNSTEDRDKLIEGVKTLYKIEGIRELHVGTLANTEKRDVVDASWQVSELIFFYDLAGQRAYQSHPVHLDFIKNYGHLWQKVVVYDATESWIFQARTIS